MRIVVASTYVPFREDGADRVVAVGAPCYALRHPAKSAWFLHTAEDGAPSDDAVRRSDALYPRECKTTLLPHPNRGRAAPPPSRTRRRRSLPAARRWGEAARTTPGRRRIARDHGIESLIT